ncbi:hypothetical protein BANRA_00045 [Klebsiella pneumoniae]|nr:hypothetical protein [Klebsiella pneumoniae]VDA52160.1 hypothetical protein BANRA_00045 [Klebsiella pneumoniae]
MKSALISPLLAGLLLLTGCAASRTGRRRRWRHNKSHQPHKWAINHFSVNGQSGIDIIGPFRGRWRLLLQRTRPLDAGYDGAR